MGNYSFSLATVYYFSKKKITINSLQINNPIRQIRKDFGKITNVLRLLILVVLQIDVIYQNTDDYVGMQFE